MSIFIRLLFDGDKEEELKRSVKYHNKGTARECIFYTSPKEFEVVPGSPFSYWVSERVRNTFINYPKLTSSEKDLVATKGLATTDDFRFIRTKWEVEDLGGWLTLAKGGEFSPYYADLKLKINWAGEGQELKAYLDQKIGKPNQWSRWINAVDYYRKPGITWSNATTSDLSARVLPKNCIISHMAPTLFSPTDSWDELSPYLAIINSKIFKYLVSMSLGLAAEARKHYEVGIIQNIPVPRLSEPEKIYLKNKSEKLFELMKSIDVNNETSDNFELPNILVKEYVEGVTRKYRLIEELQKDVDQLCFKIFGIDEVGRKEVEAQPRTAIKGSERTLAEQEKEFLSWAVGVSFGRFDDRIYPAEKDAVDEPFDRVAPRLKSASVNTDYLSSESLVNHIGSKISKYELIIKIDLEKYLDSNFFVYHLKLYTDSRRQAPIYWPLQTSSKKITFWFYYPNVGHQTLLKCVNEGVEPKIETCRREILILEQENSQSPTGIRKLEDLRDTYFELVDYKEELLRVSRFWVPNKNDGIQITAAPLWRLFQHKAWQKKLKQTWEKLEAGDYDWAHLAFSTWPERVLKKCHEDRSLAIAHDVEDDLWHEVAVVKGRKKEPVMEWQPKPLSDAELASYIKEKIAIDERLKLYRSNKASTPMGGSL
ncbi:hypothetical protein K0504_10290 [Neiella marina]|uniref:Site-specific DNA-methyltransferase (adenine-specific) n=1 Tax=Neiella holothuriorum TaxID=2870530 RepID=A0ABS7EI46_9GAMM|nr:hypothetical protein [Neiella holothuriorum]MBW8191426.1 hypothetical protein [Neiella holothuriorum]